MTRKYGMKQKSCVEYLFLNLYIDDKEIQTLSPCTKAEIEEKITHYGTQAFVAKSNMDVFKIGTSFESFHYQAKYPLSNIALLAGFLMLWLKHCIIPHPPM